MWVIIFLCIALVADAIRRYLRDGDEIPVVLGALAGMICYRGLLLEQGLVQPLKFNYGINFVFDSNSIVYASASILGGFVLLLTSYYHTKIKRMPRRLIDSQRIFRSFLLKCAPFLWISGIVFLGISVMTATLLQETVQNQGRIGNSYVFLFGMGATSFVIGFAVFGDVIHRFSHMRYIYYLASSAFALMTFNPSLRFQMLGWALFLLIYFSRRFRAIMRLFMYGGIGLVIALGFTILGSLRHEDAAVRNLNERIETAREDFLDASDVNFVDGMVMLCQVYPGKLYYSLGGEHLEILLRPIPRSIWPNKPKGSWVQKWADKNDSAEFGTGISPTIFGSFYAEAGVIGIVVFSLLYGFVLGRIFNWSLRFGSSLRTIVKAIIIASAFAVIRGGDLAGTVAFLGMSFWPIGIFLYFYINSIHKSSMHYVKRSSSRVERSVSI